jgi:hypothetical protein
MGMKTMSKIVNVSKRNHFLIKAVRKLLEHRATWLYLLLKEGENQGVEWETIGYPAVRACGNMHGKEYIRLGGTAGLKGLKKKLFTLPAQMVFDMNILESTDEKLAIDFGYCPLVAAWQKLGCTDEEIERLCDIAMEGDRGIAESYGGKLKLGGTIAKGDKKCEVIFIK